MSEYIWGTDSTAPCFHNVTRLEQSTGGWMRVCCHCGAILSGTTNVRVVWDEGT